MTTPTRASRRHDERGVVAPSRLMLIAIVVVAIGAAMFFATSPGGKDDATAASSTTATASTTPSAPATSTPASSPPSSAPSSTPSAAPSVAASAAPSAEPSVAAPSTRAPSTQAPVAVDRATTTVAVFNNSGRKGLAKRTAARVAGAGWKVSGTDNWYGTVPSTTVYFPKKMQAAAKALAADLGIRRVKAAQAPMRSDRLTLILTSDYSS